MGPSAPSSSTHADLNQAMKEASQAQSVISTSAKVQKETAAQEKQNDSMPSITTVSMLSANNNSSASSASTDSKNNLDQSYSYSQ